MKHRNFTFNAISLNNMFVMIPFWKKRLVFLTFLSGMLFSSHPNFAQIEDSSNVSVPAATVEQLANATDAIFPTSPKKYQSLLWEISGNGLKKPSYLYGTMHVSRKLAFHLSDTFFKALYSANVVALESNANQWIDELAKEGYQPFSFSWFSNYYGSNEDWYTTAFSFKYPKNSQFELMLKREEQLADAMMYRNNDESGNFSENTFLDMFIHQAGMKLGKQVTGLEDYTVSRKMVSKAYKMTPEERKNKRKEKRKRIDYYSSDGVYEQIENAYRKGDLDLLDSLEILTSPSKTFLKWMLWERNKVMVHSMDSIMKTGKVLFAGVGCAHLPGDSGMIEFLRKLGYTVRPVSAKSSKWADKQKDKIEALQYKTPLKMFVSQYGDMQASFPGIPIDFMRGNTREYFFPDMANGAYYSMMKMPYYGAFNGQSPDFVLGRIDSLLFENIPGKIIEKKWIKKSGFPAIDILNKTSQGDFQHQMIIATPTYLWFVKMVGQGEFVKKNGEPFFNSIDILEKPAEQWMKYAPQNNEYEVLWPGQVKMSKSSRDTSKDLLGHMDIDAIDSKGNYYFIQTEQLGGYYGETFFEEDSFNLAELGRAMAKKVNGKVVASQFGVVSGYPAYSISIKSGFSNAYLHLKYIQKGERFFMVGCKSENEVSPSNFLESFKFNPVKYHVNYSKQIDSVLMFSTHTIEIKNFGKPEELEDEDDERYYWSYNESEDELKDSFHLLSSRSYQSYGELNDQVVQVSSYRLNWFDKKDPIDSLMAQNERYVKHLGLIQSNKKVENMNGWDEITVSYTDTNTSLTEFNKAWIKGRMFYSLSTTYDKNVGMSVFAKNFIDSFKPFDTFTRWENPYISKGDTLLRGVFSTDSTLRKVHRSIAKYYDYYENNHAELLIETIKKLSSSKKEKELRNRLLFELGKLKHPAVVPFLKQQYYEAQDTAEYQIRILDILARNHSLEAAKAFSDLVIEETPLSENSYDDIFDYFYDTLSYAKPLIPSILELLRYPEYRDDVLNLAALMLDSGVINVKDIEPYKKSLSIEFRDEIKRTKAKETESNRYYYSRSDDEEADDNQEKYGNYTYSNRSDNLRGNNSRGYGEGYYSSHSYGDDDNVSWGGGSNRSYKNHKVKTEYDLYYKKGNSNKNYMTKELRSLAVLLHAYSNEPDLFKRYNKLLETNHRSTKFSWMIYMMNRKMQIPDTLISFFMKRSDYFYGTAVLLANNGKAQLIPDSFKSNPQYFAESFLRYREIGPKDSVVSLGTKTVFDGKDSGVVYFFKHKYKSSYYEDDWFLDFVWMPKSGNYQIEEPKYWLINRNLLTSVPLEEQLQTCLLIIKNRNRIYWNEPSARRTASYSYYE